MKQETKWTPGPWHFEYPERTSGPVVYVEHDHSSRRASICVISKPMSVEGKANARLIAAAPEMVEALRACIAEFWMKGKQTHRQHDAMVQTEEALRKAGALGEGVERD